MRKFLNFIVCIFVIGFLYTAYIWYDYVSLSDIKDVYSKPILPIIKGKVRIGIIGDSWVAGRKIDDQLIGFMKQNGFDA